MNREQQRRLSRVQLYNRVDRATDKELTVLREVLEAKLPVGLKDEVNKLHAAWSERMKTIAPQYGMHTEEGKPSPQLLKRFNWLAAGVVSGDVEICEHAKVNPAIPMFSTLWDESVHCGCKGFKRADPIEDMTCDLCREYHFDDCRGHIVLVGAVSISFGLCTKCEMASFS